MLKEVMAGTIGEIHECNSAFLVSLSLSFLVLVYDNYKCPILYSKQLRQSIYKLG